MAIIFNPLVDPYKEYNRQVWYGAQSVTLSKLQFRLLKTLAEARGEFVSRERLIHEVYWDRTTPRSADALDNILYALREKLPGVVVNKSRVGWAFRKEGVLRWN